MAKNKRKAIEKVVRKAYGDFEYSNPFILNKKSWNKYRKGNT